MPQDVTVPTVQGRVETTNYLWYDTIEVNKTCAGQEIQVFAAKLGERANISGNQKNRLYTNMQLSGGFPSGERNVIRAIGIHYVQKAEDMIDGAGTLWNFAKRIVALAELSYMTLQCLSKEYLTVPQVNMPSGAGLQVIPAIATADPAITGVVSIALPTNGVPTPSGLYVFDNPIPIEDKETFQMALGFSLSLLGVYPDPVANPLLYDFVQVGMHVIRTRPTQ